MNNVFKLTKVVLMMGIGFLASPRSQAGQDKGNGGDLVRQEFFRQGNEVLSSIVADSNLRKKAQALGVNLYKLSDTLSIRVVKVVDHPLRDNLGSSVDALGVPGNIRLYESAWKEMILKKVDLHELVFHEMLRAAGYADDDYRISKQLMLKFSCRTMNKALIVHRLKPRILESAYDKIELRPNGTTTLYLENKRSSHFYAQYSFNPYEGSFWIGRNGAALLGEDKGQGLIRNCSAVDNPYLFRNLEQFVGRVEVWFESSLQDSRAGRGFPEVGGEAFSDCVKERFNALRNKCHLSSLQSLEY